MFIVSSQSFKNWGICKDSCQHQINAKMHLISVLKHVEDGNPFIGIYVYSFLN